LIEGIDLIDGIDTIEGIDLIDFGNQGWLLF